MAAGWFTWTCLLLAGSAVTEDVVYMNQRGFQIPIRVQPERQHEVKELILYTSSNQGGNWGIYGRADPVKSKVFDFWAPKDGIYYFSVATIDARTGKQDPENIYQAPVQMKVCVDTKPPVVQINKLERIGDEIVVAWEASDERAEWTSFVLAWRPADNPGGQWTPLPVTQPFERGNHRFRVNVPGDVHVRATLKDLAGNEGADEKVAPGTTNRFDPALARTRSDELPPPAPVSSMPPPIPATATSMPPPSAPMTSVQQPPATHSPMHSPMPAQSPGYEHTPISSSSSNASLYSPPAPSRGPLPPVQIVNSRQTKLSFEVARFGPSGLGSVDVYVTKDEGATWEKSPDDPVMTLPVSPEINSQTPVRGSVTVNLPEEGKIYGFYLVVKSRAGLGKPPPMPGTAPHVRLECDTTKPEATLFMPKPDELNGSRLVLLWKATDRNLAQNPITLEYTTNPATGPWEFIGGPELPNTGSYTWDVPQKIPPKVYLKLTVRDTAGNVAVAVTGEPVLIDLTVPEVGGVQVIGR